MSGAQKFSLSLLISVVVFSGFAVLAWSGLFDYIETTFYLERVQSSVQIRVDRISESIEQTHTTNLDRFAAVLTQPSVRRAFEVNQALEDIDERAKYFQELERQLPSLDYVRFVDLGGSRLHFSTRSGDFTDTGTSRTYLPLADIDPGEAIPIQRLAYDSVSEENRALLVGSGLPGPDILASPVSNQFIYRLPVVDELGVLQGAALFYVGSGVLSPPMVRVGLLGAGDEVFLVSVPAGDLDAGMVVNGRPSWFETMDETVADSWTSVLQGERPVLELDDEPEFVLFSSLPAEESVRVTAVLYLIPLTDLQMTDIMKAVMLGALFLTAFLIVFLLLNLKQDAVVVISDRVKRFQISLLREFMENKQDLDFERWKAELEDRRGEIANRIRRGIGRVRSSKKEEVDKLIDSSWDEIVEVLGARAAQAPERGVDVAQLEETLQRVLRRVESGTSARPLPRPVAPAPVEVEPEELGEVEELEEPETLEEAAEVAELEEPEELGEVEALAEPEDLGGVAADEAPAAVHGFKPGEPIPVEEISEEEFEAAEAEELGEVEDLDEPEELGEVEELEEPEALEEAVEVAELEPEELGEVEELAKPEDLSEATVEEAPAAVHGFKPGEPIPVEEISEEEFEAAEAEELGEVEDLDEPEELGEVEELEELGELGEVEELEEPETLEEAAEVAEIGEPEELDEVEELAEPTELGEVTAEETPTAVHGFKPGEPIPVEELSEEEFEAAEAEELGEVEDLDELGELGEVEELEEPETLEEAAEVAELEEPEELGEAEEIGEPEELDEVEELAEPAEPIPVEEISEEEFEAAEAGELGEVEDLAEPEELGEVEELEEPEALEEAVDVAELEPEELGEVEELVEPEELGEVAAEEPPAAVHGFKPGEPIPVEEISEEEFEAAEAEELGEVEDLDEPEELGEVEALQEPEELEEPEELGEVEELAELAEPEKLGGMAVEEPPATVHGFKPGEPIPVEEISEEEFEAAEAEELGEVEELAEPEELSGVEELEEPETLEEAAEVAELEEPGDLGEVAEEEATEEILLATDEQPGQTFEFDEFGEVEDLGGLTDEDSETEIEVVVDSEAHAEIEQLDDITAPPDFEVLEEPDEIEPAEIAELRSVARSQELDIAGVSLESLADETAETVPLLEGESIEVPDEDAVATVQEIDRPVSSEPVVSLESVSELEPAMEPESEPTELEEARPGTTAFMSATFSFGRGVFVSPPAEALPQRRSRDAIETESAPSEPTTPIVEEPSPAQPAAATPAAVPSEPVSPVKETIRAAPLVSDGPIRFTEVRALSTDDYEIASVGDILDRLHIDKEIIVDRDGLIEIDRKVYGAQRPPADDETRRLIDAVIGEDQRSEVSGVEELFGLGATDLFADFSPADEEEPEERAFEQSVIRFVDRGFDYDGFLRGYSRSEGGIIKSLVTFTRHWNARVGVLYESGEDELIPRYGLGIEEECLQSMRLSHSSGLYRNVLENRNLLFINGPLRRVEYFRGLCTDEQIVLFQKAIFVPVVIDKKDGYALLGIPDAVQGLEDAFNSIVPVLMTSIAAV